MNHYPRYPKYKDSGVEWIEEVPEHWTISRIDHIATTHRENISPENFIGAKVFHYSIPVVQERGTGAVEDSSTVDSNKLVIRCPQVLVSKLNPRKQTVVVAKGHDAYLTVASTEFVPIVPKPSKVTMEFIHYLMSSEWIRQYLDSRVESVTKSHQRVTPDDILKLKAPVPELPEQTSITLSLDQETARIDALIAKKTRFIELLKEKHAALITHAVTKGLNPTVKMKDSGVEWIGEVPAHWTIAKLKHVSRALIGLTYAPEDVVDDGTGITVLRSSNIQDGQLDLADIVQVRAVADPELMVRVGDILICSRNGSRALIGKNIQLDERSLGCTFGAFMTVVRGSFNDFLYYVFNSTMFDANSALYMTSTVNQLTISMIANMEVPLPPEEEQRAIVSHLRKGLSSLEVLLCKTQRSIDLLKERRSALISAAVTGKVDVRGWVPNAIKQPR